jgi:hypothetical protein
LRESIERFFSSLQNRGFTEAEIASEVARMTNS